MDNLEKNDPLLVSSVAIIGMAGRFPGAGNVDEFWTNLRNGVESISFFTEEEVLSNGVSLDVARDPHFVGAGGVLEAPELFDAAFFNYSPAEAALMDPQHRIFLECAYEALENAGYDSWRYSNLIGVYAGSSFNTYFMLNLLPNFDGYADAARLLVGNEKDFVPTRVSYQLNLRGPSFSLQAGCSTSLYVTHVACQSLLNGECDIALAGSVSIAAQQKIGFMYRDGGIWSADGHCRAFDAKATGSVSGNGLGILVLKRLEDALADNDTIHAVIKGSAITNDGHIKMSFSAPSVQGEAKAIADALAIANIDPETVTYIEAHGTATPVGDPIEIAALTQVFNASTQKKQFCAIGSVKTNIGHLDTAAGMAGLIKSVLALEHQEIPPSLHFEQPNPLIHFEQSPFYVNTKLTPWHVQDMPRRAGISSYGVGGTNAHIVLEEAPIRDMTGPSRSWQLLLLSSKTASALETMTNHLATHFKEHRTLSLPDVAYTLQVGRRNFAYRRVVVCQDVQDALSALEIQSEEHVFTSRQELLDRPLAFLFPGQGSQYINMARDLYREETAFREQVDQCADLLQPLLKMDLRTLIYPPPEQEVSAVEQLNQIQYSQVALFVIEYSLARLWMSWGLYPQAMLGHSLGEYVAACLSGVFSLPDILSVVVTRGKLMQSQRTGAMLAVALPEQFIKVLIDGDLCLAAVNGPSQCTVSGSCEAISALQQRLALHHIEYHRLKVSHAAHSSMMDVILDPFIAKVRQIQLKAPQIPYVSNVTGTWIKAEEATDPAYWGQHLRQTVRFSDGLHTLLSDQQYALLEVGPGRTMSTLVRQHPDKGPDRFIITSLRHTREVQSDVAFLLTALGKLWLAGISVDWERFNAHEVRRRVPLPTYPFERQRYWVDLPTQKVQRNVPIQEQHEPAQPISALERQASNGLGTSNAVASATSFPAATVQVHAPRPELLNAYVPPNSETEQKVATIWQQFLGIEQIGAQDNFFELGGHSMMGLQISASFRENFAVDLPLRTFLVEAPTVSKTARSIDELLAKQNGSSTM